VNTVSHHRNPPVLASTAVITLLASARIDAVARGDNNSSRPSASRQVAAARSHKGSNPVPEVHARAAWPESIRCRRSAPQWR